MGWDGMTWDFHCELGPVPSHRDQSQSRPIPQKSFLVPSHPTEVSPGPGPIPSHARTGRDETGKPGPGGQPTSAIMRTTSATHNYHSLKADLSAFKTTAVIN